MDDAIKTSITNKMLGYALDGETPKFTLEELTEVSMSGMTACLEMVRTLQVQVQLMSAALNVLTDLSDKHEKDIEGCGKVIDEFILHNESSP